MPRLSVDAQLARIQKQKAALEKKEDRYMTDKMVQHCQHEACMQNQCETRGHLMEAACRGLQTACTATATSTRHNRVTVARASHHVFLQRSRQADVQRPPGAAAEDTTAAAATGSMDDAAGGAACAAAAAIVFSASSSSCRWRASSRFCLWLYTLGFMSSLRKGFSGGASRPCGRQLLALLSPSVNAIHMPLHRLDSRQGGAGGSGQRQVTLQDRSQAIARPWAGYHWWWGTASAGATA